ncbi:MAG: hypothetical protein HQM12_17210 [SAR324 cluster bacterium]|nr:hypothetical protein [SAR324 cluster bacterium]
MKDLFLYTADADTMAFMSALLKRPQALGIRPITFEADRHPQRDAGMVQTGAELTRMRKGQYQKALLLWDHHGSGREHQQEPQEVASEIQEKLNQYTWSGNSAITILVPELEQWLWYCEQAVATHCKVSVEQLQQWTESRAHQLGKEPEYLRKQQPKELFEHLMKNRLKRTISPRDFEVIGSIASISALERCESFKFVLETLRIWFPK